VSSVRKTFKEYHPAPHREVSILQVAVVEDPALPLVVAVVVDLALPLVVAAEVQDPEAVAEADRKVISFKINEKAWLETRPFHFRHCGNRLPC
jgi:hypothetical protein